MKNVSFVSMVLLALMVVGVGVFVGKSAKKVTGVVSHQSQMVMSVAE